MKFEPLDPVTVYTTLRDALRTGGRELHVGMFFYFWVRSAAFNVSAGTISTEENARNLEAGLALLERPDQSAIKHMAAQAETKALSTGEGQENRLMIVAYWSSISYYFRYLGAPDWKFVDHASDAFLSGIEDCLSDEHYELFKTELANAGLGFEAAETLSAKPIVEAARAITRWASALPVGSILPPLA